jgi:hypothetical protein
MAFHLGVHFSYRLVPVNCIEHSGRPLAKAMLTLHSVTPLKAEHSGRPLTKAQKKNAARKKKKKK